MKNFYNLSALFGALLVISACSDSPTQTNDETQVTATHTAYIELENNRHALYIQTSTDAAPRRIRFTGDAEDLPSNDTRVPKLTDTNILALHSPRWSPDGSQLAFVASTAFDQAELVVINADGTRPRIVSLNSQYVMGEADWSPDGKRIVYAMSTQPAARGLELFVSDVEARTWKQITQGSGYSGLGGGVRFDATGTNVYFSKAVSEEPAAPFNFITDVRRVSANGGPITTVVANIVGNVQAIERSGSGVLVMKNTAWTNDGRIPRELARVSLTGAAPRILATGTSLQVAHYTDDDNYTLLLTETSSSSSAFAYHILPTTGGAPILLRGATDGTGGMDVRVIKR